MLPNKEVAPPHHFDRHNDQVRPSIGATPRIAGDQITFERRRRLHNDDRKEITAMIEKINTIERTELTSSERKVLAEDRARWKRMGAGAHLDDWLS